MKFETDMDAQAEVVASPTATAVPPPLASDLAALTIRLRSEGLRGALEFLNRRTSHRFTGVFRFDGDMLRNVALVDKWDSAATRGEDVPLAQAYCAHLHDTGEPLEVQDGSTDPRVPWMADSAILSYCGAPIQDDAGERWGALCHFDPSRCEGKASDLPLLRAAAAMLYAEARDSVRP